MFKINSPHLKSPMDLIVRIHRHRKRFSKFYSIY